MYLQTAATAPGVARLNRLEKRPTPEDVFEGQPTETFAAGEALFWEDDPANQIFQVVEGVLRVHRLLSDGRRAILGFLHPGDLVGAFFQNTYQFTAEAVNTVGARKLPRNQYFSRIGASQALSSQFFAQLSREISTAQDQMLLLGRKSAQERVVSFLLAIQRKTGAGAEIELPMTRLDIADHLGLTVETVSRNMASLRRRGLIADSGRHGVTLRKLGSLREIAGGGPARDAELREARPVRRAVWPH